MVTSSTPNNCFLPHEVLKLLLAARGKWSLGYEGSFSRRELFRVGRQLGLRQPAVVGSAWLDDVRRYSEIVRNTQTFRRWFPAGRSAAHSPRPVVAQQPHRVDDYLGHDIALLGIKLGDD
jgi:hypothetical protein